MFSLKNPSVLNLITALVVQLDAKVFINQLALQKRVFKIQNWRYATRIAVMPNKIHL